MNLPKTEHERNFDSIVLSHNDFFPKHCMLTLYVNTVFGEKIIVKQDYWIEIPVMLGFKQIHIYWLTEVGLIRASGQRSCLL